MRVLTHPLNGTAPGTQRHVTSLHFGTPGAGPKAVLQASLHADEVPPMLVAQHLRRALAAHEAAGEIVGEIVLVPAANPVGLAQRVPQMPIGRFDLESGQNFNRHYADLHDRVTERAEALRLAGGDVDVGTLRRLLREACATLPAESELASLRRTLLALAIDADTVLDLHCDNEAILHLYTTPALWPAVAPLARALRCPLALLAGRSGDDPFDEACSVTWERLQARYLPPPAVGADGAVVPARPACVAATVELRGEADVRHDLAAVDAAALLAYLRERGHLSADAAPDADAPPAVAARPLAGSMPVAAPRSGVLVYLRELGTELARGEPLAEIIDPVTGEASTVPSPVDGLFYAREVRRYVPAGARIAKVAGTESLRQGRLMSA